MRKICLGAFMAMAAILYTISAAMPASAAANAPEPAGDIAELDAAQSKATAKLITAPYSNWGRVAIDGKLAADRLPVKPTLRIYMEKNKLLMISLRAPLLGEVGRLELTPDSILVVNKMNSTYTGSDFSQTDIFSNRATAASLLGQLQSLLLSRVVLPGKGELSMKNYTALTFYRNGDTYMLLPKDSGQNVFPDYGFINYADGRLAAIMVSLGGGEFTASMEYMYKGLDTEIEIQVEQGKKEYEATLTLEAPQFGAKGFERFKPGKKYRKVTPAQFMRSF